MSGGGGSPKRAREGSAAGALAEGGATKRAREGGAAGALADSLECALCLRLLHRPVALPCGHAHCRECTALALRAARRCPVCRAPAYYADPAAAPLCVALDKVRHLPSAQGILPRARRPVRTIAC